MALARANGTSRRPNAWAGEKATRTRSPSSITQNSGLTLTSICAPQCLKISLWVENGKVDFSSPLTYPLTVPKTNYSGMSWPCLTADLSKT